MLCAAKRQDRPVRTDLLGDPRSRAAARSSSTPSSSGPPSAARSGPSAAAATKAGIWARPGPTCERGSTPTPPRRSSPSPTAASGRSRSARTATAATSGPASDRPGSSSTSTSASAAGSARPCGGSRTSRPAITLSHTVWNWSAGVGDLRRRPQRRLEPRRGCQRPGGGKRAGDLGRRARTQPREPGPVSFDGLDGVSFEDGTRLGFAADAERQAEENRLVVKYSYRQPFGRFSGSLAGLELAEGIGVMEHQDAVW